MDDSKPGRTVLGIETATPHGSVALYGEKGVVGELILLNERSHSEKLLPSIDILLKTVGLTPSDLSAVAVSKGPGSFTGIRIGVAAAKGLALSLGIPLYGIPSLEVLATNAAPGRGLVRPVIDARRREIFTALYDVGRTAITKVEEAAIVSYNELADRSRQGSLLLGTLPLPLKEILEKGGSEVWTADALQNFPRAAAAAQRGLEMFHRAAPSETETLLPFYLRPSDAEGNKQRKARKAKEKKQ